MIYDFPDPKEPIRQGDIFIGLPRFDFSLKRMPVVVDDHSEEWSWEDIALAGKPVTTIISARPITSIVISQNCDTIRAPDINLCEIREFKDVEGKSKETKKAKSWVKIIIQQARINQKWFYLPPDEKIGFQSKMGVDFLVTIRVPRLDLENLTHLRKGRLNNMAGEHFRERIAEFFRRYPYDEWYPLDNNEMEVYQREYPETKPYPWQ